MDGNFQPAIGSGETVPIQKLQRDVEQAVGNGQKRAGDGRADLAAAGAGREQREAEVIKPVGRGRSRR
jgi:hypothetical protein